MVTVRPLDLVHAHAITDAMRTVDVVEIFGLRHDAPDAAGRLRLAQETSYAASLGMGWAFLVDDVPAALLGAHEMWPGAWSVWAYGTDQWLTAALAVTRVSYFEMRPELIRRGCRFAEALSHETHVEAHAWMMRFGARVEAKHHGYGRDGSTYFRFVWRPPDHVLRRGIGPQAPPASATAE